MNLSHDGFLLPPPPATVNGLLEECYPNPNPNPNPDACPSPNPNQGNKRKRNSSRELDEETEVVALSPKSLMATYRFICEICNKGFQRDQNLQLHRRGHNLPWKLKQRAKDELVKKKVYVCPEGSCVHHEPSRALGDLTGIKKHFSRKHGDKKWKCDKCPKKYAVVSDLKAHAKICGTRQYKCDCATVFSRKDSFMTHRAFCDALTEERMRNMSCSTLNPRSRPDLMMTSPQSAASGFFPFPASHRLDFMGFEASSSNGSNSMDGLVNKPRLPLWFDHHQLLPEAINSLPPEAFLASISAARALPTANFNLFVSSSSSPPIGGHHTVLLKEEEEDTNRPSWSTLYKSPTSFSSSSPSTMSAATALLQRAATSSDVDNDPAMHTTAFNDNAGINLHQPQLLRQQGYTTANDHLASMGNPLCGDASYENGLSQQCPNNTTSMGVGMRDFLGGLGGNTNGGEQGRRRAILQEEMAYTKFATMADVSHNAAGDRQEPYMDFMR